MATKALLVHAMAAAVLGTALGASYTVGAPAGSWDLQTKYDQWTSNIKFQAGDQLVVKYARTAHNVLEVNKADYDSCSSSSPIASFQTGIDVIPLATAGSRYFICGVPGHCDSGMKIRVNVEAPAPAPRSGDTPSPLASLRTQAPAPAATIPSARAPAVRRRLLRSRRPLLIGVESSVGLALGAVVAAGLMIFY